MSASKSDQATVDTIFGRDDRSAAGVVDGIFESAGIVDVPTDVVDQIFGSIGLPGHQSTAAGSSAPNEDAVNEASAISSRDSSRSASDRALVGSAVVAAAELAKGHRSTAVFMMQTKAANDASLTAALLAGASGDTPRTASQMAKEAVDNYLGTQAHD